MQAHQLHGRAIVALDDARKIGQVEDILLDPAYQHVIGFRVTPTGFVGDAMIVRNQVQAIGPDALTVSSGEALILTERLPAVQQGIPLRQVIGTKVVTQDGKLLGVITDVEVDDAFETVLSYTLDTALLERLFHGAPHIPAQDVIQVGTGGMMIVQSTTASS